MRFATLLPAIFLLTGILTSGCGNAPGQLPGKIAFVSNQFPHTGKTGSNYGIFVYDKGKIRPFYQGGSKPRWNATGERLFVDLGSAGIGILAYPSGELLETISRERYMGAFAVSRDGRHLIYEGWERANKGEDANKPRPANLFIYDLETKTEEQLTSFTEHFRKVSIYTVDISRDGKTIVFTRDDRNDQVGAKMEFTMSHVYLLDLETKKITDLGRGNHARFLPSEDALVYASGWLNKEGPVTGPGEETEYRQIAGPGEEDGHPLYTIDLIKYNLKTGQRTRMTNNERFAHERVTSFSPDGRYFASDVFIFGGGEKGRGIRLFKSDGTQLRNLIGYDGYDYQSPDWGP